MLQIIWDELNGSFTVVSPLVAGTRLSAALFLGGIIGFERERKRKPAGLRTHMLVAMAACLFIVVGQQLGEVGFGSDVEKRVDPLRLIEAVTQGVAFLAAGIIFTARGRVRHVTTGASMWLAGAVGLGCGAGQVPLAAMATLIVVAVLVIIRAIERRMGWHDGEDEPT
ncbi:MgtC/SapB family protein [Jannaschia ovalis]|uniref:Protein MgtC n=1 Tax=Jannaschia ovalis TaxID=3038773 RepID=A0ABY8LEG3_9RHOB|nr:MgtC/SapB family protein [Jannaschia sp. GRR-S6-38]WGH79703.1 MgtC/SapB family protein [Jannaschia sp. GRR-S6-38]